MYFSTEKFISVFRLPPPAVRWPAPMAPRSETPSTSPAWITSQSAAEKEKLQPIFQECNYWLGVQFWGRARAHRRWGGPSGPTGPKSAAALGRTDWHSCPRVGTPPSCRSSAACPGTADHGWQGRWKSDSAYIRVQKESSQLANFEKEGAKDGRKERHAYRDDYVEMGGLKIKKIFFGWIFFFK